MTEQSSEAVVEFITLLINFLNETVPHLPEGELRHAVVSLLEDVAMPAEEPTDAGASAVPTGGPTDAD